MPKPSSKDFGIIIRSPSDITSLENTERVPTDRTITPPYLISLPVRMVIHVTHAPQVSDAANPVTRCEIHGAWATPLTVNLNPDQLRILLATLQKK